MVEISTRPGSVVEVDSPSFEEPLLFENPIGADERFEMAQALQNNQASEYEIPAYDVDPDVNELGRWARENEDLLTGWIDNTLTPDQILTAQQEFLEAAGFSEQIVAEEPVIDRFAMQVLPAGEGFSVWLIAKELSPSGGSRVPFIEGEAGQEVDPQAYLFGIEHYPD